MKGRLRCFANALPSGRYATGGSDRSNIPAAMPTTTSNTRLRARRARTEFILGCQEGTRWADRAGVMNRHDVRNAKLFTQHIQGRLPAVDMNQVRLRFYKASA